MVRRVWTCATERLLERVSDPVAFIMSMLISVHDYEDMLTKLMKWVKESCRPADVSMGILCKVRSGRVRQSYISEVREVRLGKVRS